MSEKITVTEFTEVGINLKNTSKEELLRCFENELSAFDSTQAFRNARLIGHVSVVCKPDSIAGQ